MEDYPYPLVVINDRYSGAYSGGGFTAWNLYVDEIPTDIDDSDNECMEFWITNKIPVGIGSNPEEAIEDLKRKL